MKTKIVLLIILAFVSSELLAQDLDDISILGLSGTPDFTCGYFGFGLEYNIGKNAVVGEYKLWDVVYQAFNDEDNQYFEKMVKRNYISAGVKRYLREDRLGPYIKTSISFGLSFADEAIQKSISQNGILLGIGCRVKIFRRIIGDINVEVPVALQWPIEYKIDDVFNPSIGIGLGYK